MPATFRSRAQGSHKDAKARTEVFRGTAKDRGYDSTWAKASKTHLKANPLCAYCKLNDGKSRLATLTDHLYPQQTFAEVFWERKWWVACCAECHNGFKQSIERQGKAAIDGLARQLGREVL